jgi:hypothetical protein
MVQANDNVVGIEGGIRGDAEGGRPIERTRQVVRKQPAII